MDKENIHIWNLSDKIYLMEPDESGYWSGKVYAVYHIGYLDDMGGYGERDPETGTKSLHTFWTHSPELLKALGELLDEINSHGDRILCKKCGSIIKKDTFYREKKYVSGERQGNEEAEE